MIIVQFDAVYHHWGLLLLRSLALHEPEQPVLADVVNLEPASVAELHAAHPRAIVLAQSVPPQTVSPAWMANRKTRVLWSAMCRHPDEPWYALFDADFLVRRPLSDLWQRMDGHPAALFYTNGVWNGRRYPHLVTPSGLVLVRSDARHLVERWIAWQERKRSLDGIRPGAWFWDQVTLLAAARETAIPFSTLPMAEYADCSLRSDSAIWSAHVSPTDKDRFYRHFAAELERQIAAAPKKMSLTPERARSRPS
jgi:hypothetical protein